ncbi:MAG: cobalamin biosynthesis protein CobD [Chloroflexi bacterium]|nr:cobalamin biosynthesis protein CobD [Chloroflexota bacterium]
MLNAAFAVVMPALVLDALVGDPISRWHPVALFGSAADWCFRRAPNNGAARQLAFGASVLLGSVALVGLGSAWLLFAVGSVAPVGAVLVGVVLFKSSFAYRQLRQTVLQVADAVRVSDLFGARRALRALVSRDTADLDAEQAGSAAIESLAENLSDSLVAPFLYYVLLGVPGALAYRVVNTLDAMVGYHGEFEFLGKAAAKVDDWANWIPARMTAGLLIVAAWLARAHCQAAFRAALRDHARPESPNAGWPMAAMAGALDVELEKLGHYRLGTAGRGADAWAIRQAVRVADIAAGLAAVLLIGVSLL